MPANHVTNIGLSITPCNVPANHVTSIVLLITPYNVLVNHVTSIVLLITSCNVPAKHVAGIFLSITSCNVPANHVTSIVLPFTPCHVSVNILSWNKHILWIHFPRNVAYPSHTCHNVNVPLFFVKYHHINTFDYLSPSSHQSINVFLFYQVFMILHHGHADISILNITVLCDNHIFIKKFVKTYFMETDFIHFSNVFFAWPFYIFVIRWTRKWVIGLNCKLTFVFFSQSEVC